MKELKTLPLYTARPLGDDNPAGRLELHRRRDFLAALGSRANRSPQPRDAQDQPFDPVLAYHLGLTRPKEK